MGSHVHGTASEWFSAGITLHELLTGRRPFEASRLQAFRYAGKHNSGGGASAAAWQPDDFQEAEEGAAVQVRDRDWGAGLPPRLLHPPSKSPLQAQQQPQRDLLWPDFLYQQCDHLTPACKDFVRALLIPDVSDVLCMQ